MAYSTKEQAAPIRTAATLAHTDRHPTFFDNRTSTYDSLNLQAAMYGLPQNRSIVQTKAIENNYQQQSPYTYTLQSDVVQLGRKSRRNLRQTEGSVKGLMGEKLEGALGEAANIASMVPAFLIGYSSKSKNCVAALSNVGLIYLAARQINSANAMKGDDLSKQSAYRSGVCNLIAAVIGCLCAVANLYTEHIPLGATAVAGITSALSWMTGEVLASFGTGDTSVIMGMAAMLKGLGACVSAVIGAVDSNIAAIIAAVSAGVTICGCVAAAVMYLNDARKAKNEEASDAGEPIPLLGVTSQ